MTKANTDVFLEFATMEEILSEVGKRHTNAVILFTSDADNTDDPSEAYTNIAYRGGIIEAIGLTAYAHHIFLNEGRTGE